MTDLKNPTAPQHSPGPYRYRRSSDGCDDLWEIVAANGRVIATIPFWDCDPAWAARSEADARLLAAAPALLRTLKELYTAINGLRARSLPVEVLEAQLLAYAVIGLTEREIPQDDG